MMGWDGGIGWGGWLFMGLFWLVLLGVILYLVVQLLPAIGSGAGGRGAQESPEEILDRRFARGEIDVETYQAQREALAHARGRK
jgi:putative membrane protein